ncbi:MAG: helix-turn-helix domain-containing protein [Xenococcaceae cyanobacterium]
MKVSNALKKVMTDWKLSNYQVSKVSGIDRSRIGKLLKGEMDGVTWNSVEKILIGLEKIDPVAKAVFWHLLWFNERLSK